MSRFMLLRLPGRRVPCLVFLLLLHATAGAAAQERAQGSEGDAEAAVRQVLLDAYVSGVHVERNPEAVRRGFHPDFVMMVRDEGRLLAVPLQAWLDRLELDATPTSDTIRHVFRFIDVTNDAATASLEIWENGAHVYTDYFSLYRFLEGWRIVGKTFHAH